jgi:hypothetical protein
LGASSLLRRLQRLIAEYGPGRARPKLRLLTALERLALPRAREVWRLHETLCFLRAYPDDVAVLARVERMLARFERRPDLRRHRRALADTGIAGTFIRYRFFAPTASWLVRLWGDRITIDWPGFRHQDRLEAFLSLLALYAETPGLDEIAFTAREWIERMKGQRETDAAFLIRRFDALPVGPFVRERLYDDLDPPLVLAPGPDTPARGREKYRRARLTFQTRPLSRARPSLEEEVRRPPVAIRPLSPRAGQELIDLARAAMVTRSRDLDVFSYADRNDVCLVDCGQGLQFAGFGAIPERRLLLEAVYGFLTLKNGVPIGYVLASALYGSAEVAYNVFDTYRGQEASLVYGRVLAMLGRLFGADSFTIVPFQLGHENDEALRSGAWWFYQKLGFRPRHGATLRLMRQELRRMGRDPAHRSPRTTLEKLSTENVYLAVGPIRRDVLGLLPLADVGLRITRYLARRFGSDREEAARVCAEEAAERLGVRSRASFSAGERLAWERWGPLLAVMPGLEAWRPAEKRALVEVVRAKGGRRESEFVARFDRHRRLRRAVRALAEGRERA